MSGLSLLGKTFNALFSYVFLLKKQEGGTSIPDNKVNSNASEADNSDSACATITITMRTAPNEGG